MSHFLNRTGGQGLSARRYLEAIAVTLVAFALRYVMEPYLAGRAVYLTFLCAVLLSGIRGGVGPAILSLVFSSVLSNYYFLDPPQHFFPQNFNSAMYFLLFLSAGLLLAFFSNKVWVLGRRLGREKERYHLLVDEVFGHAIFFVSPQGIIKSWNRGVGAILGYGREEFIGKHVHIIYTPEDVREGVPEREIATALREGKATDDRWHVRKDGARVHVSGVVSAIRDKDGTVVGLTKIMRDNTEKRILEEKFELAVDASPAAMLMIDGDGKISFANSTSEKVFGYSRQELVGRQIRALLPDPSAEHPPSKLKFGGVEHSFACRKNGDRVPIEISIAPVQSAEGMITFVSVLDISERKAHERALQERDEENRRAKDEATMRLRELESVYESAPVGLCFLDTNMRFARLNGRLAEYNGLPVALHLGHSIFELFPKLQAEVRPMLEHVLCKGEPVLGREVQTTTFQRPDVMQDWLVSYVPVRGPDGNVQGINGAVLEITEHKRIERELKLISNQSERANKTKDAFIALVSHELRTPLSSIVGWSSLIERGTLSDEEIKNAARSIKRGVAQQARLIEDLLDVSRIAAGKLSLDIEPFELQGEVHDVLNSFAPQALEREVHLQEDFTNHLLTIQGDAHRIRQIVGNLVSNAIKFTEKGGTVTVTLKEVNSQGVLEVRDTGSGIAKEALPFIFERFRQADEALNKRKGGLGLGLHIVKNLVELHGGSIEVVSEGRGRGARFIVRLPLMQRESLIGVYTPAVKSLIKEAKACPADLTGLSVVIVEDEEGARTAVERTLEECHATVVATATCKEAIDTIRDKHPDVIVSDIQLPDKDGFSLIRELRYQRIHTPAIALTAFDDETTRKKAKEAGFDIYIVKPISPEQLVAVVGNIAGKGVH